MSTRIDRQTDPVPRLEVGGGAGVSRRCLTELTLGFDSSSRQLRFHVGFIKEQRNNSVLTTELGEKRFNMTALIKRQM